MLKGCVMGCWNQEHGLVLLTWRKGTLQGLHLLPMGLGGKASIKSLCSIWGEATLSITLRRNRISLILEKPLPQTQNECLILTAWASCPSCWRGRLCQTPSPLGGGVNVAYGSSLLPATDTEGVCKASLASEPPDRQLPNGRKRGQKAVNCFPSSAHVNCQRLDLLPRRLGLSGKAGSFSCGGQRLIWAFYQEEVFSLDIENLGSLLPGEKGLSTPT